MSGLLTRAGYEPIIVRSMEAAKEEVSKLPPVAVVVTAMKFAHGTAQELINWQKQEGYKFPVIAVVDNLNAVDLLSLSPPHDQPWNATDSAARTDIRNFPSGKRRGTFSHHTTGLSATNIT